LYKEKGDPKYKADLDRDIAELDLLIDEILLASRLDATRALPSREEVDLVALVAEESARYGCMPEGVPVNVEGDPRLLRRLVRNLIENARRHGQPPVRVEVRPEDGQAVLSITDAGQGIPPAERERIFLPFQRLSTDPNGTGLGLALVRQIARLHGGDAVVAPRADAQSCFRITLPRFQPGINGR
jgi:signal transduction histidine kinase